MSPLDRRRLFKAFALGGAAVLLDGTPRHVWKLAERVIQPSEDEGERLATAEIEFSAGPPLRAGTSPLSAQLEAFDQVQIDDYFVEEEQIQLLVSTAARLERAQTTIGHGRFNLIGFDSLLRFARRYSAIGEFPRAELDFLDELFHRPGVEYGFHGTKLMHDLTGGIPERAIEKIQGSGHFLLKGRSLDKFERIQADLGKSIFLTSGVRALGKQFQLFLSKAVTTSGNLSQASRSLAPPGYSYHATGDFDLGKVGWGLKNFSSEFAKTEEYRRLIDLGYVDIRYTPANPFGVRHEPWHIKISEA